MINIERIKNTDKTIWRYMDLWKFESMLEDNGCLYFTRSDMFNDKLEGKYSDITLKNLEDKKKYLFIKIKALFFIYITCSVLAIISSCVIGSSVTNCAQYPATLTTISLYFSGSSFAA